MGLGDRGCRHRVGRVRRSRRPRPDRLQADGRLHVGEPHGLHRPRRRRCGDSRRGHRAGARRRGHRRRHPDGQPRPDHRRAVPPRRGPPGPGRHLRHGLLRRPRGTRTALRRAVRRRCLRLPRPARALGFIAEFQIFTGSIAAAPVTAVALVGILITAALFLRALQRIFTGETRGRSAGFGDLRAAEVWSVGRCWRCRC